MLGNPVVYCCLNLGLIALNHSQIVALLVTDDLRRFGTQEPGIQRDGLILERRGAEQRQQRREFMTPIRYLALAHHTAHIVAGERD